MLRDFFPPKISNCSGTFCVMWDFRLDDQNGLYNFIIYELKKQNINKSTDSENNGVSILTVDSSCMWRAMTFCFSCSLQGILYQALIYWTREACTGCNSHPDQERLIGLVTWQLSFTCHHPMVLSLWQGLATLLNSLQCNYFLLLLLAHLPMASHLSHLRTGGDL